MADSTVALQPELEEKVAAIAAALDRPKSWVVEEAVREFVTVQASHLRAIEDGIADANAGRVVNHDEVAAWVRSWGRLDELPTPECK